MCLGVESKSTYRECVRYHSTLLRLTRFKDSTVNLLVLRLLLYFRFCLTIYQFIFHTEPHENHKLHCFSPKSNLNHKLLTCIHMISYIITFLFDSSLLLSTQMHKKDKNVSQQAW